MNEKNISYEGKKVFIGIDVHFKQYTVTCRSEGTVVRRCTMPAKPENLVNFVKKFFSGATVETAYEAGFSGFVLHRVLKSAGIANIVVHAAAIEVSTSRVKTDKRDSARIAEQLEAGRLKGINIPSEEQEWRRLLNRTREQVVRSRTRIRNQIRMRFHYLGLMPLEHRGVLTLDKVKEILILAKAVEIKQTTEALIQIWAAANQQISNLECLLKEQAKHDPLEKIYRQVPGIGKVSSRILANELGDMSQFKNERQLFSFTGLTPSEYSSDETRHMGRITRQGPPRLRHLLTESAWVAIKKDPALANAYTRIAQRAGGKKAIVAVARRLIGRARVLFRKKEDYRIELKTTA